MQRREIAMIQDAQRAVEMVRENAKDWNVDPARVGIMGFSAGGYVAAIASTRYHDDVIPVHGNISRRPDFTVLAYPVVSLMDSISGIGKMVLGASKTPETTALYSADLQVDTNTPPAFLVHARDDRTVTVKNSINYYNALQRNGVRSEIHVYEQGGHGFGLNNRLSSEKWTDWLKVWMEPYLHKDPAGKDTERLLTK
jgi:acetyl esterase/lipase